jgi:1-acyl-sn-glycerol-3-phosphate acyltransferase
VKRSTFGDAGVFDGDALDARDPELIAEVLPAVSWYMRRYVRLRAEGLERLGSGPALLVANHNGGIFGPDLLATLGSLWNALGPAAPLYALAHDFAMKQLTPLGRCLQRLGALRASPDNARRALARGAQVLVYPGGDLEAYRHFSRRNRIVLGGRHGYLRVARQLRVPIQPVVTQGAHCSALILCEGRGLARMLRLRSWARLERFPLALCLPWGISVGPWLPYLPLPFRLRLRVLPRTFVSADETDECAHARITADMQRTLNELCEVER